MDFGIKGKGALVMSSSRGLGFAIASALAAEGVNVVLTGRSEENLKSNAAAINARGQGQAFYKSADLMDSDAMGPLVAFAKEQLGQVDILINNTGGPPPGRMVDADQAAFSKHFNRFRSGIMPNKKGSTQKMIEQQNADLKMDQWVKEMEDHNESES